MMELKDTVQGMLSDNYKERLVAEYQQLKIRITKLKKYYNKLMAARLISDTPREPEYEVELLGRQLGPMEEYLKVLELRAEIEHIDLEAEGGIK